jgi:hypothetical protein
LYSQFTPTLPPVTAAEVAASAAPGEHACDVATIPGAPGVFAAIPDPGAAPGKVPSWVIGYATPGAAQWQVLASLDPLASGGEQGYQLWQEIAGSGPHSVQVVGNWLFVGGAKVLSGTPDFGRTWSALSEPLIQQHSQFCPVFAVDPDDPMQLFCATFPMQAALGPSGVSQSQDGGVTWQDMGLAGDGRTAVYTVLGASDSAVYASQHCGTCQGAGTATVLLQHPIHGGAWQRLGSMPGVAPYLGITPDNALYAAGAAQTGGTFAAQAYQYIGEKAGFQPIGNRLALPLGDSQAIFGLGGVFPGGQPALYLRASPQTTQGSQPAERLYRLALPPTAAGTPLDATPLPTAAPPLPTPTPQTVAPCTTAAANLATIRPGGLGADISTFAARWGPVSGGGHGIVAFGRYADRTPKLQASPADGRVMYITYFVDPQQQVSANQVAALVQTIVPADAMSQGPPAPASNGQLELTQTFCSAAYRSLVPSSGGTISVTYHLRSLAPAYYIDPSDYTDYVDIMPQQA